MLGLVVLAILAGYLLVSGVVVWLAARWAKKHNRRPWVWGGLAAFAMYNLVFWDWIPAVAMHKYYCATEAGFWVYKMPEQWAKENPGVLETLEPWPASKIYGKDKVEFELNGGTVRQYNDRFGLWNVNVNPKMKLLPTGRRENGIVDINTGEFLVYHRDFIAGPRRAGAVWKSWLKKDTCNEARSRENGKAFREIVEELQIEE